MKTQIVDGKYEITTSSSSLADQSARLKCLESGREIELKPNIDGAFDVFYKDKKYWLSGGGSLTTLSHYRPFQETLEMACAWLATTAPGIDELEAQKSDPRFAPTGSPELQAWLESQKS